MRLIAQLIASGDMSSEGSSTSLVPYVGIAAAIAVALMVQRSRLQKAKGRVDVRRIYDAGRVALDRLPAPHSLTVGVRMQPDPTGTQLLLET